MPDLLAPSPVLLVGATSEVGDALLLRLALAGFEIIAHLPDTADAGRTGEFACRVVRGDPAMTLAAEPSLLLITVRDAEDRVDLDIAGRTAALRYAPLMPTVIAKVRRAPWWDTVRDPWNGQALPLVHPMDVAEAVVRMVQDALVADAIGGPESFTWRELAHAVWRADGARRWWHQTVGTVRRSNPAPSHWAAVAAFPRIGRRRLADALSRRDSAAHRRVALDAAPPTTSIHL
jgi:hypothetical protein